MSGQFAGWSVEEAAKRVLGPRTSLQRAIDLLPFLESQQLVAYEFDPGGQSPRRLSLSKFGGLAQAVISADKRSSKQIFGTVVLCPAVCAPDAPSILGGHSLKEVMSKFVIGDPELTRLAPDAVAAEPTMRNFIEHGHFYPNGCHEWRVTSGTHDEDAGEYGDDEFGRMMVEHDWPNPAVRRVRQLACFRFGMLMRHLSTGAVEAVGDPMRSRDLASILPSIWDHSDYYISAEKGDVLLINDNSVGRHDQFIRRWAAVVLRNPRASSSTEATNSNHWSERAVTPPAPESPLKAEKECCLWLEELMRKSSNYKPKSKVAYRDEAKARWKRLSERGFDKAWSTAVQRSGAWAWSKAGRPTESGRVEA